MKCLLYLALVSVQARSLNLNWSQSSNWSWRDSKGPTAAGDKEVRSRITLLQECKTLEMPTSKNSLSQIFFNFNLLR